jgi:hypothetical protein
MAKQKNQPQHQPAPQVPWSPDGIIMALQFWKGDQRRAFELSRLIADIEPIRRNDCALYLCCDGNTEQSEEMLSTLQYCESKFPVGTFQSMRAGNGHPDGPNVLWSSTMEFFFQQWSRGGLKFENVFTFEADGVPLRKDWITQLIEAHRETLRQRLLVTASVRHRHFMRHPNGNLISHVSVIRNYPELLETPPSLPWDMHHHTTLTRLARHDTVIRSEHRSTNWSAESLASIATETAWLHGCRDDSVLNFARGLVPVAKVEPRPSRAEAAKPAHRSAGKRGKPSLRGLEAMMMPAKRGGRQEKSKKPTVGQKTSNVRRAT